jgi:uncharacterized protein YdcH (DUF465 family)
MITKEKLEHHIAHLQEKHDALDEEISKLEAHHENVTALKKEKLHLKDEIEKFKIKVKGL